MDATSIIAVIGATTAAVVTIINALVAFKTNQKVETIAASSVRQEDRAVRVVEKVTELAAHTDNNAANLGEKLEVIRKGTDGTLSELREHVERLEQALARGETRPVLPSKAEVLAAEAAERREEKQSP